MPLSKPGMNFLMKLFKANLLFLNIKYCKSANKHLLLLAHLPEELQRSLRSSQEEIVGIYLLIYKYLSLNYFLNFKQLRYQKPCVRFNFHGIEES